MEEDYMTALMPDVGRGRAGRKPGTATTEPSTFVARLRAAMGCSHEKLAREIGVSTKTAFNYTGGSIIPKNGAIREKLEALGKLHGVPIQEPQA
jgi:ribosome-binding protein aMBF1 (putative translation factor)